MARMDLDNKFRGAMLGGAIGELAFGLDDHAARKKISGEVTKYPKGLVIGKGHKPPRPSSNQFIRTMPLREIALSIPKFSVDTQLSCENSKNESRFTLGPSLH